MVCTHASIYDNKGMKLVNPPLDGVRPASESSIEIGFWHNGKPCIKRLRMKPSPSNLQRAARLREEILAGIEKGDFDYAQFFPPR